MYKPKIGDVIKHNGQPMVVVDIVNHENEDAHILIVSHGAIITWFLNRLDKSITTKVDNLSYAHLTYSKDDGFKLMK